MGTVNNDMMPFYNACISAFKNTDYHVIMSVGNLVSMDNFKNIPENISIFPYIDQIAVLKQADVFLSHCGMNSVSESLYFEVPLVMFPQTTEQKGVAKRVLELNAGIIPAKSDSKSILNAVNEIFFNKAYKKNAEKIAKGFKDCPGAKGAANKISEICLNSQKDN